MADMMIAPEEKLEELKKVLAKKKLWDNPFADPAWDQLVAEMSFWLLYSVNVDDAGLEHFNSLYKEFRTKWMSARPENQPEHVWFAGLERKCHLLMTIVGERVQV